MAGKRTPGTVFFISHPEVLIDAAVPVPQWRLSERGVARMRALAGNSVLANVKAVWASTEAKAVEAAEILARELALPVNLDAALGENDRSATGFLPPAEFNAVANAFFANPHDSVRGWERAIDAQSRIRHAFDRILETQRVGDLAIVAHGGVGTLLLCDLLNVPISRELDQPSQGHVFRIEGPACEVIHRWMSFEQI